MNNTNCKLPIAIIIIGLAIATNANAQVTGSGTGGQLPIWTGSGLSTNLGTSQIQDNGTNTGIGAGPAVGIKLNVGGDINSSTVFRLHNYQFLGDAGNLTNCYVGRETGFVGNDNTFVGYFAGNANTGNYNTYVGSNAGATSNGSTSFNNTAVGYFALNLATKYGGSVLGFQAACSTSTGCGVTAMGELALFANTIGNYNCAFGHRAGQSIVTGSNNTFLGNLADVGSTGLNNSTAIGANAITSNSNEMILGDNSVYVGIGYSGVAAFPPGKLSVDENVKVKTPTIAGFFHNGDETSDAPFTFQKKALYAYCDGLFANESGGWFVTNLGGDFEAGNAEEANIAVRGRTGRLHVENYGLYGYGGVFEANRSANDNIGVWTSSDGSGRNTNYGIYAYAPIGTCSNGGCSDAAGYFDGDVYTTSAAYFTSDANLKDNIRPIQNATSIINLLNPKTFTFRTTQFPYMNLPLGNQDGLLAQDVKNVLPQLVSSFKVPARMDSLGNMDTTGTNTPFMAVNYIGLIPYLIGAVKEQSHNNDSLINLIDTLKMNDSLMSVRLNQLEQLINNCCSASGSSSHRVRNPIDVELGSENSIILNQNDPNPFAEQTRITYSVPVDVKVAKIIFFDNSGHVMQTVIINDRGDGQLNVYGEKLSSGIYSYTLLADGKVIDTKKMVCSK